MIRSQFARRALFLILPMFVVALPGVVGASSVPVPKSRPAQVKTPDEAKNTVKPDESPAGKAALPVPKPRPSVTKAPEKTQQIAKLSEFPDEEAACRARLSAMGVRFSPVKQVAGEGGCGIRHPVRVSGLPDGVKLSGRTVLGCDAAEALANWTAKAAVPEARQQFGSELKQIDQYASYVCRTRNSLTGTKLSEHAKGKAVDLGRFHLSDGTVVDVASRPKTGSPEQLFLKALRDSGCQFFTTVLGPGSDDFHSDHYHFDLAKRRRGYRYCK
ncbi:extensin family protein [Hoeflea sp. TYP-13]|uniref:extensin family protein n=1 Tax=Hoeflea sp. TYP-13 TaxID=3230023 RepID=UPI0034C62E6E